MICETIPNKKNEKPKKFTLTTEKDDVKIVMKVGSMSHSIKVKIIQFGVNSNKATTGHKLQGVSLKRMVVRSWGYRFKNWVYIVLSRVRTLDGLFLCEKMDDTKNFDVDPTLLEGEDILHLIEQDLINF